MPSDLLGAVLAPLFPSVEASNETSYSIHTAWTLMPLEDKMFLVSWFILLAISFILTLLYLYTFHQNRELEKKTAVYPILNHFNSVVKVTWWAISTFIGLMLILHFLARAKEISDELFATILWLVHFVLGSFILYFLVVVSQVQYILHFLLAIQRLLLYFIPSSEKYVNLSEKAMGVLIKALYLLIIIKEVWVFIRMFRSSVEDVEKTRFVDRFMEALIILQLISAVAYIPVIISIRKLTNLVSIEKYKPHHYIFYQMLASLIIRSPFIFIVVQDELQDDLEDFWSLLFFDIVLTPISIQLAYLLCNQRNIRVLMSFSLKNAIKALIFGDFQPNQVGSEVVESTRAQQT